MAGSEADDAGEAPDRLPGRPKPDRRAEALRANLKRRKLQARAREDAGRDGLPPAPQPGGPDGDG